MGSSGNDTCAQHVVHTWVLGKVCVIHTSILGTRHGCTGMNILDTYRGIDMRGTYRHTECTVTHM